jgi:hypothetical protein
VLADVLRGEEHMRLSVSVERATFCAAAVARSKQGAIVHLGTSGEEPQ